MKKIIAIGIGLSLCCTLLFLYFRINLVSATGSLLAYWKFDESSVGSTAVDSSGNGYNGAPHNSPSPSTDVSSTITFTDPYSLNFDGTQWVSIPDNAAFAMTSATFSTWVKFTDLTVGDMDMIAKRSSDGSQVQWQFGYNASGNQFKVSLANGGHSCCTDYHYSPSPALTKNTWYNIAIVIDGVNHTLTWYQNGVSELTQSISGTNLGTEISADLTLGASYNGTGELLKGLLDDTRIYNATLSASDISSISSGNSGPDVPTAAPTPTSIPTPTPIPNSSNNSGSSPLSTNTPTSCTNPSPISAANLFQITTSSTTATIYFTPVTPSTGYVISYGTDSRADQYTASLHDSDTSGVISYTINSLLQNTSYYFKVQGMNGCMPGNWSQTIKSVKTRNETKSNNISEQIVNPTAIHPSIGTISIIQKEQNQLTSNTPQQEGYNIAITVMDKGQPVSGATVELHSIPMKTVTDNNGIARFTNVEKGNHTVILAYQGFSGKENVTVSGAKKDVAVKISIQLNPYTNFIYIGLSVLIGIFVILVGMFLFLLKKRKKSED